MTKARRTYLRLFRWGLAGSAATLSSFGTTLGSRAQMLAAFKRIKVQKLD